MTKKYKVIRRVSAGQDFVEIQFGRFRENIVGRWKKLGIKVYKNRTNEFVICEFCLNDSDNRRRHWEFMKPLLYKVAGRTHEEDKYDWAFGKCKNENGCWGPYERIFDVKITKDNKYFFFNTKVLLDLNEEVVDEFFIKLERNLRTFPSDVIVQEGIGWFPRHPMERLSNLSLFINMCENIIIDFFKIIVKEHKSNIE